MAILKINGDTSGGVSLTVPAVAGSNTATVPAQTGTLQMLGSGTAVSASGTSVDFTGIPSWVKRITIMFSGISTNGTSLMLAQIGSGSVTTSGYNSSASYAVSASTFAYSAAGFVLAPVGSAQAAYLNSGVLQLVLLGSNTWVASGTLGGDATAQVTASCAGRSSALSGALDRVRITTTNGTDVFDAGTINIMYE